MRKLADYEPVLKQLMRICAKETSFTCEPPLEVVMRENPQLVVALMHATPFSWVPSMALLALQTIESGGQDRKPMGVIDNFFFHMPVLREIAHYLTQSDRSLSFPELSNRFRDGENFDLILFPEGSNCFFGWPGEIQEFRSSKFVELAIETGTPILLGVHIGSEKWSTTLPIPESWMGRIDLLPNVAASFLEKRLRSTGLLTLPLLPLPMGSFSMKCELYQTQLKKQDLANAENDIEVRRTQVSAEANRVRERMQIMLSDLRLQQK